MQLAFLSYVTDTRYKATILTSLLRFSYNLTNEFVDGFWWNIAPTCNISQFVFILITLQALKSWEQWNSTAPQCDSFNLCYAIYVSFNRIMPLNISSFAYNTIFNLENNWKNEFSQGNSVCVLIILQVTLRASSRMHDKVFRKILRSPMSFFDVTPVGRLLNGFSKDMDEGKHIQCHCQHETTDWSHRPTPCRSMWSFDRHEIRILLLQNNHNLASRPSLCSKKENDICRYQKCPAKTPVSCCYCQQHQLNTKGPQSMGCESRETW